MEESPQPGREDAAREDVARRPKRSIFWRGVGLVALALALVAGGWLAWYLVRVSLAAQRAYQDVFVSPAPRRTITPTSVPVAPTTIRLPSLVVTPTPTPLPSWEGTERVNVLLIGIDTTPERAGEGALPLADAIIVASIDPVSRTALLLSIPRDLVVDIPGFGWDRINAAYAYGEMTGTGGPTLLIETVEQNFQVPITGFAEVDFEGFVRLVDLLGGVVVDVPAPIKDDEFPGPNFTYQRLYFAPGLQHLNGARTLAYVRTRHDDNDLMRGLRQQQVLRALRRQALRIDALARLPQLLEAMGRTVRTDLSLQQALALARLGMELSDEQVDSLTLADLVHDATLPSGAAVLIGDWPAIRSRVAPLRSSNGTPVP